MDFGSIIKRSWQITWKYKALWVLGVFAGISGCQGGSGSGSSGGNGADFGRGLDGGSPDFGGFVDALQKWLPALIAGAALLTIIGIVWWVFAVAARGGLIVGVNDIEEGRAPALGGLWTAGFSRFWSLVGLDIVLKLPIVVVGMFVLVGVVVPLATGFWRGGEPGAEVIAPICGSLGLGLPVLIVLSFILGIMDLVARRYLMLGGQGVFQAAGNSWRFFRARFKDTFLMWLISALLNLGAAVVVAIPLIIVGVGIAVPAAMAVASESWQALIPVFGIGLVLIVLVSFAYAGIWGTYTSALWTIFFRRVTGMEPQSVAAATVVPVSVEPYGYPAQPQPPVAPPAQPYTPPPPPMAIPSPPPPPSGEYPANPPTPPAAGV